MMKLILGLSVACNVFLGYSLLSKKSQPEVVERLIIETHADATKKEKAEVPQSRPTLAVSEETMSSKEKKADAPFVAMESPELQEAAEKMESERMEFLTTRIGLSEEQIAQHNKLRDEFYKETSTFWGKNSMRELSFKERRQMLDLEEKLHKDLEKLHGKKNWERFQKFREAYNQKGFEQQTEENRPFIFMGL
jgi:hypothetical protein